MARTIPNKGYRGIYGEEAAGKSPDDVRNARAKEAANDFSNAEKSASAEVPKVQDNTTSSSTDVAENGASGQTPRYNSGGAMAVGGAAAIAAKATPMGRFASMFRGNGKSGDKKPLFAIGGLTGLIAVLMLSVSSLLPIHLISNMIDLKNSFNTVADRRTDRLIRRVIGKENADAWNTWSKRNKISPKQMGRLNRGLEAEGLRFVSNAFDGQARLQILDVDGGGNQYWRTVADGDVEFARLIRENPNIRNSFNRGAKTMKGPIAGWFGKAAGVFTKLKVMTRNLFKDFIGGNNSNDIDSAAKSRLAGAESKVTGENIKQGAQAVDDDGNPRVGENGRPIVDDGSVARNNPNAARARIEADIRARASDISSKASLAQVPCAIFLAVAAASTALAIAEGIKALQVVAGWFEAGQKMIAGDGDDSYHAFGAMLTAGMITTAFDDNGNEIELHNGAKLSATESAGLTQALVGGTFSAENDPSASNWHAEQGITIFPTIERILKLTGVASVSVGACVTLMLCASIVSGLAEAASVAILFIPIAGQVAAVGKAIKTVVLDAAKQFALAAGLSAVIGVIVPRLATWLTRTVATDVGGEDFGNMVASIGGRYMYGMHQANGGVVATKEQAYAYHVETQAVLAEQAALERLDRSAFDVTSRHTFLGSIAYDLSGFATSSGSLLGKFNGLASVAQMSHIPWDFNASASSTLTFEESLGNCPQLSTLYPEGIDESSYKVNSVACDLFGNPMRSNDMRIVEFDPEYIFWKTAYTCDENECSFGRKTATRTNPDSTSVTAEQYEEAMRRTGINLDGSIWMLPPDPVANCSKNNGECNGNWYEILNIDINSSSGMEMINRKSELGKMVEFGVNRTTDPGTIDMAMVMGETQIGPSWLGWIPVLGDIIGAFESSARSGLLNNGWVDGKKYCNGCTPEWDTKYRYLNQYLVDLNLYEGMEAIDDNPMTAFLETEILPYMDMSFEGIIARNMGMPKDLVVGVMAFANDLRNAPQDAYTLIASAPNIYSTYYGGWNYNDINMPERDETCRALNSMRECTQIAGTELRRRFNAEAVA